jgi:hypothetical protein
MAFMSYDHMLLSVGAPQALLLVENTRDILRLVGYVPRKIPGQARQSHLDSSRTFAYFSEPLRTFAKREKSASDLANPPTAGNPCSSGRVCFEEISWWRVDEFHARASAITFHQVLGSHPCGRVRNGAG